MTGKKSRGKRGVHKMTLRKLVDDLPYDKAIFTRIRNYLPKASFFEATDLDYETCTVSDFVEAFNGQKVPVSKRMYAFQNLRGAAFRCLNEAIRQAGLVHTLRYTTDI